jgi:hypothetical protein
MWSEPTGPQTLALGEEVCTGKFFKLEKTVEFFKLQFNFKEIVTGSVPVINLKSAKQTLTNPMSWFRSHLQFFFMFEVLCIRYKIQRWQPGSERQLYRHGQGKK